MPINIHRPIRYRDSRMRGSDDIGQLVNILDPSDVGTVRSVIGLSNADFFVCNQQDNIHDIGNINQSGRFKSIVIIFSQSIVANYDIESMLQKSDF